MGFCLGEVPSLRLALCLGYVFLLRASEFLPVMHLPGSRHLKGGDLLLRREGKTDRYNKGATRNHFRGDPPLCPVDATIRMFTARPERYSGMEESHLPLLRSVTRENLQMLIARGASHCGMEGAIGAQSLRFEGASAIWAAFHNSAQLQRFGRWTSDVYHEYIWDARNSAKGVAQAMANVDLMPP